MELCYTAAVMTDAPSSSTSNPQVLGRFFTVAEVARQLRVSNMTVYRLIKSGQLPAVRVGRGYRIRDEDVRKYLNERYMDAG
jgi:excisionase family DNA binding protein